MIDPETWSLSTNARSRSPVVRSFLDRFISKAIVGIQFAFTSRGSVTLCGTTKDRIDAQLFAVRIDQFDLTVNRMSDRVRLAAGWGV